MLKVGNTVKLHEDAVFVDGRVPAASLFGLTLYVRVDKGEGVYTIARGTSGLVLGDIKEEYLINLSENAVMIDPYVVMAIQAVPLYAEANNESTVIKHTSPFSFFTIIDEKEGMGKVKIGKGWLDLNDVMKCG